MPSQSHIATDAGFTISVPDSASAFEIFVLITSRFNNSWTLVKKQHTRNVPEFFSTISAIKWLLWY